LIEEIHDPKAVIPFRMLPLIFASTIVTHFFGGSAGREGTAVQMAGAIADQWAHLFKKLKLDRQQLLMMGMAAGFSSVFGTPLAGAIFGVEVLAIGRVRYGSLLPCLFASVIAHFVCISWGIQHTAYSIGIVPALSVKTLLLAVAAGVIFGLCSWFFTWSLHRSSAALSEAIASPFLRVFLGALVIIALALILQTDRYLGLGIPSILNSFAIPSGPQDFILKILFTVATLSVGFKGGEVTPLFFIGATLGSFLSVFMGLPTGLLAGMGFAAVFAGAANVPLASLFMALEMFGGTSAIYMAIAVLTSYVCSSHHGIYSSQKIEVSKHANKN
jgi:H+/Cl- antiporter ClcA